jgi:hypothetical protein
MKYKTLCKLYLKFSPSIFPLGEYSVLEQFFFVNGNGLFWKNGELTEGYTIKEMYKNHEDYTRAAKENLEDLIKRAKDLTETVKDSEILKEGTDAFTELLSSWLSNGYYGPPPDPPDPNHKYNLHPLWERSTIMKLPDNIKDDWLLAAEKALNMIRDGIYVASEKDKKFLKKARLRVNKLKKSRGMK